MAESRHTIEQIIKVMLKHVDRKIALRIVRDLYGRVHGSKGITDTFRRVADRLSELDEHET